MLWEKTPVAILPKSLKKLRITAKGNENIMPGIIHCVKNNCTLGEISDALRLIFSEH